jgi:hypothetical protein
MSRHPIDPERIADATARRLLARAAELDDRQLTLEQLRDAASEAGISTGAFDAAVAEWRRSPVPATPAQIAWALAPHILRNAAGIAAGWISLTILDGLVRVVAAPFPVRTLTDSLAMALGALVAAKLRARTATILLGGFAVSQAVEFVMNLLSGGPAINGFRPHMTLLAAGIASVALGVWLRRPTGGNGPSAGSHFGTGHGPGREDTDDPSQSRPVDVRNSEADYRVMELLRPRRTSSVTRFQLS